MGFCRIRILFDCNLAFLEPDVFSSGMREPLNAIPKGEKPASHQVVGAESPQECFVCTAAGRSSPLCVSEILRRATTKAIMIHKLGYHRVEINTPLTMKPIKLPSMALARYTRTSSPA